MSGIINTDRRAYVIEDLFLFLLHSFIWFAVFGRAASRFLQYIREGEQLILLKAHKKT